MFKNLKVFVFILCVVNLVQISLCETPVRKCPNGAVKPLRVQVNSCTETPCKLVRGYTTNMDIQFVSNKDNLNTIKADTEIKTVGTTGPLRLSAERSDVCKNLMFEANCPINDGEDATYRLVWDILPSQPDAPATIQVIIRDTSEENSILACFILDARIEKYFIGVLEN